MPVNIVIHPGVGVSEARFKVNQMLGKLGKPDVTRSVKHVAKMWAANYKTEGSQVGGWVQLAESTVREREKQGFSGAHPILIRQGSLYAMSTLFFMQGQAGSASGWSTYGNRSIRTTASLEITGGKATLGLSGPKTVHQKGNWTPPKRQYWFTDRNVVLAARLGVLEWIRDEVIPR
jgi:hypothetical protein